MHYTTSNYSCSPPHPCNRWRECDYCAKRRQRVIAETSERNATQDNFVTFAVIQPFNPDTKAAALRRLPAATRGGIWTIETGEKVNGLHLNMLIAGDSQVDAAHLAQAWRAEGARIWAEPVALADVRNVAAYMSKRRGMPSREDYDGRLWGTFGGWQSLAQIARNAARTPILQAAQAEHDLVALGIEAIPTLTRTARQELRDENGRAYHFSAMQDAPEPPQPARTAQDYAEIARAHLPRLYALTGRGK